jgi:hypothetical protein
MVVCCIASGPSLTKSDCDKVGAAKITTIAVNNSWQIARFADYIYSGDHGWWRANGHTIDIPAKRVCCDSATQKKHGVIVHLAPGAFNSGQMAIRFAIQKMKAKKVILLGYDCSLAKGIHWHGPHTNRPNPDEARVRKWVKQFQKAAEEARVFNVDVINCSRETALECFRRENLEDALEHL